MDQLTFNGIPINTDPPMHTVTICYTHEGCRSVYAMLLTPADAKPILEQGWFMLYDRKCVVV